MPKLLPALWSTLVEIADSKKATLAILTVLAGVGGRFGLHMDPVATAALLSPMLAFIFAQAHVDAQTAKASAPLAPDVIEAIATAFAKRFGAPAATLRETTPPAALPPIGQ